MTYRVSDEDIAGYYRDGYVVFRGILPPTLIADLRVACERGRAAIYGDAGDQDLQRLQPVSMFAHAMDLQPFRDYAALPALHDAIAQVLSPQHAYGRLDVMGVLLHPQHQPYCMRWHRDMTLPQSRLTRAQYQDLMLDWDSANQINCPLYDDTCTWFVPGSHLRWRDLPGETAWAARWSEAQMGRSARSPDPVQKERTCRQYTAGMPGAVQLRLAAGDFCIYRPLGWHTGNYLPYQRRATLHDVLATPRYETWWRAWRAGGSPAWIREVDAPRCMAAQGV